MAIFVWEGRTAQGRVVKGDNLEAPNLEAALARLREQRIRPIQSRVKEKGKGLEKEISIPGFGDKATTKDISLATRQLATMIDAGLPIVQCLRSEERRVGKECRSPDRPNENKKRRRSIRYELM